MLFQTGLQDNFLCSGFAITISAQELFQHPLPTVSPVTKVSGGNQNSEQMSHQAEARNLVAALLHPFDAWLSKPDCTHQTSWP